jgi:RNA polymerase subunit RPABC4/transcription elongation factor Spt4
MTNKRDSEFEKAIQEADRSISQKTLSKSIEPDPPISSAPKSCKRSNHLIACKDCGKTISKDAKVCPHCGKKNKSKTGCGVLVVVMIFGLIIRREGTEISPFFFLSPVSCMYLS